jgi:YD repeat-containing protein
MTAEDTVVEVTLTIHAYTFDAARTVAVRYLATVDPGASWALQWDGRADTLTIQHADGRVTAVDGDIEWTCMAHRQGPRSTDTPPDLVARVRQRPPNKPDAMHAPIPRPGVPAIDGLEHDPGWIDRLRAYLRSFW